MTLEELKATEEEVAILQLFELWQEKLVTDPTHRSQKLVVANYNEAGIPLEENSPLALMFTGFMGGVQTALAVMNLGKAEDAKEAGEGAKP